MENHPKISQEDSANDFEQPSEAEMEEIYQYFGKPTEGDRSFWTRVLHGLENIHAPGKESWTQRQDSDNLQDVWISEEYIKKMAEREKSQAELEKLE